MGKQKPGLKLMLKYKQEEKIYAELWLNLELSNRHQWICKLIEKNSTIHFSKRYISNQLFYFSYLLLIIIYPIYLELFAY